MDTNRVGFPRSKNALRGGPRVVSASCRLFRWVGKGHHEARVPTPHMQNSRTKFFLKEGPQLHVPNACWAGHNPIGILCVFLVFSQLSFRLSSKYAPIELTTFACFLCFRQQRICLPIGLAMQCTIPQIVGRPLEIHAKTLCHGRRLKLRCDLSSVEGRLIHLCISDMPSGDVKGSVAHLQPEESYAHTRHIASFHSETQNSATVIQSYIFCHNISVSNWSTIRDCVWERI